MTDSQIQTGLPDVTILALTMWAEARGDSGEGHSSLEERVAVGMTCRNRVAARARFGGTDYKQICLASGQYSCWNGSGANHLVLMGLVDRLVEGKPSGDPLFDETLWLASGVMHGILLDRTVGATHYYAPDAMVPPGRVPSWAVGVPSVRIGTQEFLRA